MHKRRKYSLFCITALLLMLAAACSSGGSGSAPSMIGFWADPNNVTTTVQTQNGILTAVSVYDLNQPQGQNLVVSSGFAYGALIWRYCKPDKTCTTLSSVTLHADTMDVNATNDSGKTSQLTLKRVAKGTP